MLLIYCKMQIAKITTTKPQKLKTIQEILQQRVSSCGWASRLPLTLPRIDKKCFTGRWSQIKWALTLIASVFDGSYWILRTTLQGECYSGFTLLETRASSGSGVPKDMQLISVGVSFQSRSMCIEAPGFHSLQNSADLKRNGECFPGRGKCRNVIKPCKRWRKLQIIEREVKFRDDLV